MRLGSPMVDQAAQHELQGSPQTAFAKERQHGSEQSQGREGESEGHRGSGCADNGSSRLTIGGQEEEPQLAMIATNAFGVGKPGVHEERRSIAAQRTGRERRESVPVEAVTFDSITPPFHTSITFSSISLSRYSEYHNRRVGPGTVGVTSSTSAPLSSGDLRCGTSALIRIARPS